VGPHYRKACATRIRSMGGTCPGGSGCNEAVAHRVPNTADHRGHDRDATVGPIGTTLPDDRRQGVGNASILVLHKAGVLSDGLLAESEGAFLRSGNTLTERDGERIAFETLPDGDIGLRTAAGGRRMSEGQSLVSLSDGSFHCIYRTVEGCPACAYRRDDGYVQTPPAYASHTPGGRRIKHPRGQLRLTVFEREVPLLVPQPRRSVAPENEQGGSVVARPQSIPADQRNGRRFPSGTHHPPASFSDGAGEGVPREEYCTALDTGTRALHTIDSYR